MLPGLLGSQDGGDGVVKLAVLHLSRGDVRTGQQVIGRRALLWVVREEHLDQGHLVDNRN